MDSVQALANMITMADIRNADRMLAYEHLDRIRRELLDHEKIINAFQGSVVVQRDEK